MSRMLFAAGVAVALLAGGMPVDQARAQAIARHVPPSVWNHELKLARMGDTSQLGRVIPCLGFCFALVIVLPVRPGDRGYRVSGSGYRV